MLYPRQMNRLICIVLFLLCSMLSDSAGALGKNNTLKFYASAKTTRSGPVPKNIADNRNSPTERKSVIVQFQQKQVRGYRSHCGGWSFESDVQPRLAEYEQKIRGAGFTLSMFKNQDLVIQIAMLNKYTGRASILKSSGLSITDQTALELLEKASPFVLPEVGFPENRPMLLQLAYPKLKLSFSAAKDADSRPSWSDLYSPTPRAPNAPATQN